MQVIFKVIRQTENSSPQVQTYRLEAEPGNTILDCLNRIKWEQDGSLAFRKNCRNTICGSCVMRINGRSALACKENVDSELLWLQQLAGTANNSQKGVFGRQSHTSNSFSNSRNYRSPDGEYAGD